MVHDARDTTYCSAPSNISRMPAMRPTTSPTPARTSRKALTLPTMLAVSAMSAATSAASAASPTPVHRFNVQPPLSTIQDATRGARLTLEGLSSLFGFGGDLGCSYAGEHGVSPETARFEEGRDGTCGSGSLAPLCSREEVRDARDVDEARAPPSMVVVYVAFFSLITSRTLQRSVCMFVMLSTSCCTRAMRFGLSGGLGDISELYFALAWETEDGYWSALTWIEESHGVWSG